MRKLTGRNEHFTYLLNQELKVLVALGHTVLPTTVQWIAYHRHFNVDECYQLQEATMHLSTPHAY